MKRFLLLLSLVMVFGGGFLAHQIQTNFGTVDVNDVRFMGSNGTMMSGLLYVPDGVSAENPAPGILAVHGYINSRETQDGFAIEFARRGYVVLALDQTGHGYSDPPAFANGFGGPDGLAYLRSLDIVDKENVGLEGHSMGGWAVAIAAGVYPDAYESIVMAGSSTGTFGAPEGTPEFPRNLGLIFSEFDEFSELMWGSPIPANITETEKLQTLFATDEPVEVGRLYGSVEEGTARRLYQPPITHPWDHFSHIAIGDAVEWMQLTLEGGTPLDRSNQIWIWKEIGNLIALLGMILFLFPFGGLLLESGLFRSLKGRMPASKGATGVTWVVAAVITLIVPIVTYFWLQNNGSQWFPPSRLWPQQITTGIAVWAVGNGLITLVLFLVWHFTQARGKGAGARNYGLTAETGSTLGAIWRSLLLSITVIAGAYLLLAISDWIYKTDFRIWVVAVKPMSAMHLRVFLSYLPAFVIFFLILSMALNGQMRRTKADGSPIGFWPAALINSGLLILGFVGLLLFQYIPLFAGGVMPLGEPLLTIVAYQFVPLLTIVAFVCTYFFRQTGQVYTGAFISALLITWIIVASQATQFPLPM